MDFSGLHCLRDVKDGISFFEMKINLDLFKGDHNPKFEILFIIFSFKIFEIEIYNINHFNKNASE